MEDINQLWQDRGWNEDLTAQLFPPDIWQHIINEIPLITEDDNWDHAWWMQSSTGKFTVGTAWELMRHKEEVTELYRSVWIKAARLWKKFSDIAGVRGPFLQIKWTIHRWWNANCNTKLKPLYQAMPVFIPWQIGKARNTIKHGAKFSFWRMEMEVNCNISLFAKTKYPWLIYLPNTWSEILLFLHQYKPTIHAQVVKWTAPTEGVYKCNTDGSFIGETGSTSCAFCIRNWEGDLVYAESSKLQESNSLLAEVMAVRFALEHYLNRFTPLLIETDSLIVNKVLQGHWEVPWAIVMDIKKIRMWLIIWWR
ncbi:hypothetical protein FXO38_03114 [Capsicum annuum]|nr:hypothetical protein FXO38_03114 [Capsicum annuum]